MIAVLSMLQWKFEDKLRLRGMIVVELSVGVLAPIDVLILVDTMK
jgi:hypothetical protein